MNSVPYELELIERELTAAYGRLLERRRRTRRAVRIGAICLAVFCAFTAVAFASGIDDELHLDPAKWTIFERGSVADGSAAYVKAHANDGGGDATFMVEHDASLGPYPAFLLHERVVAAAGGDDERGAICTAVELTRAEAVALRALARAFAPGARPEATRAVATDAVRSAFAAAPCRGLAYAAERARFVYAGIEPRSLLMPGAR